MESNLGEVLQDTYERTLKLAVDIAQNKALISNNPVTGNDMKLVRKIAKDYKEFKDLNELKRKKPKPIKIDLELPLVLQSRYNKTINLPKNSGKEKLCTSLDERNRFVSGSKAGKLIKYAEIGPGILEKIKTTASIYSEDLPKSPVNDKSSTITHVSIRTGKVKAPLELPSFKDYAISERLKDPKDIAFEKINKCNKHIDEFSKELDGLEMFVSENPGVRWNNDKKLLLRLQAFPKQAHLIIKAYNDQFDSPLTRKTGKKQTMTRDYLNYRVDKMLSQTPHAQHYNDYSYPQTRRANRDPGMIVSRCYSRFSDARDQQNKKLISILDSLNVVRPVNLTQKAIYILNDNEKFRDKSHSLMKMNDIKKKIDLDQSKRLKKSKKQAYIYDQIMEFLKKKAREPTEAEINFVEVIKEVLEEGWCLENSIIQKILEFVPDEDIKDLQPLLELLKTELEHFEKAHHFQ